MFPKEGCGGIIQAVKTGDAKKVRVAIDALPGTIDIRDVHGKTALMYAVELGNVDIVKQLLRQKNIDVNISDLTGNTPLHLAYATANEVIQKLLVRAGADGSVLNSDGLKPKDLAIEAPNIDSMVAVYAGPPADYRMAAVYAGPPQNDDDLDLERRLADLKSSL